MADRALNEVFDAVGEWHLPETPEQKIAGTLRYSPHRTELHLNEAFQPLRGSVHVGDDSQFYAQIYGVTREGEAMTLLNAQRTGVSFAFGSGGLRQPERVLSSCLLVGAHVPPDFVYPKVRFRVPGLQVWLSRPIVEQSHLHDDGAGGLTFSYHVRRLPEETTRVPRIDASLLWGNSWRAKADPFTSVSVTVSGWITIHPDAPRTLEWYMEQQRELTTMLAFLAGAPMSPDCIQASTDESHHEVSAMVALHDAKYCPYTNLDDFYMPRNAMGIDLALVVGNWFERYPKVHKPSQLALSVLASERLWLHVEFLSLIQALEGFHRGLFDGNYMTDEEYDSVKKALGDAIPPEVSSDHKDALRSRIRYGNQFSLRKRLDEVAALLPEFLRLMILGGDGEVPRRWVDTRNYYTHWDEELRSNILDDQGMYYANVRMGHLLRALYLDFMGIAKEAIHASLCNASKVSQHLAQLNAIDRRRSHPNDTSGIILTVTEQKANNLDEQIQSQNEVGTSAGPSEGGVA